MRCFRMRATFRHYHCLHYQTFYIYDGQPCKNCHQGKKVLAGIYDDADIIELEKLYSGENFSVENQEIVV